MSKATYQCEWCAEETYELRNLHVNYEDNTIGNFMRAVQRKSKLAGINDNLCISCARQVIETLTLLKKQIRSEK